MINQEGNREKLKYQNDKLFQSVKLMKYEDIISRLLLQKNYYNCTIAASLNDDRINGEIVS